MNPEIQVNTANAVELRILEHPVAQTKMGAHRMQHVQISGENVYLREVDLSDKNSLHAIMKRKDVMKWTIWEPHTADQMNEFMGRTQSDRMHIPRKEYDLCIVERQEHVVVGMVNMTVDAPTKSAEIGYFLHPQQRNRGYATEAVKCLLKVAFEQLNLHRIWAKTDIQNTVSAQLLERAGFQKEGVLRDHMWLKEAWRTSMIFSYLSTDPRN